MKIGFLIVDMQNMFLRDHMVKLEVGTACEYINHVSGLLRSKGHAVIHIQDMEGADGEAHAEARDIIPEIQVGPQDIRIEKQFSNAFWKTDLEQVLRDRGVGYVVVAGFAAEQCVTFTMNGANERGFQAAFLQHGIVSTKADAITSMYRDRHVVSYSIIDFMVNAIG